MLITLGILIYTGNGISKSTDKKFWRYGWLAIITFTLVEGTRFLRGADYPHYMMDLNGKLFTDYSEPGYLGFIYLFHDVLNLPFYWGFILYSFIYITPIILIFKERKTIAKWGLPAVFLITQMSFENIIRQYIGISFILFASYFFIKGDKKTSLLFLLCAPFFHLSALFPVVILLIMYKFNLDSIWNKSIILVCIYLAILLFWNVSYFSNVTSYIQMINLGNDVAMQGYIDNADRWFSAEGLGDIHKGSIIIEITKHAFNLMFIYYGSKLANKSKAASIAFGGSYLSIIIFLLSGEIEIYQRFAYWLAWLIPIYLGYMLSSKSYFRHKKIIIIKFISLMYLALCGSMYLILVWKSPYAGCGFLWDYFK